MANTVIAIFEKTEEAQSAQNQLLASGILKSQVNLKTASYKSENQDSAGSEQEHGFMDNITAFFRDLLGTDHKDVPHYVAAGKHRTIVTVHTETSEEAEQVAQILDDGGALDVNETSGSYFPESEKPSSQHQFSDDALHHSAQNQYTDENRETHSRVKGIRSRIVQRSADKGSSPSES